MGAEDEVDVVVVPDSVADVVGVQSAEVTGSKKTLVRLPAEEGPRIDLRTMRRTLPPF